ncbi:MAG: hypothetical protein JSS65_12620 [Armatimonadetes bacterium]|nr:hypothetical protein [Armatimonadota bacterium]
MVQIDESPNREALLRRYTLVFAGVAVLLALLPTLIAFLIAPPNSLYLGHQTNVDDHMVYAAWMRQAMEGRFLFDNRFTTDAQPGLTVHLYFLLLGWIAKVVGLTWAVTLARAGLSFLFVWLLGRWLASSSVSVFAAKAGMTLATLGGGIGFLCFTYFGKEIFDKGNPVVGLTGGWLPVDVWQPEVFVFPSMLTNSLFMVSLCLIVVVLRAIIDARSSSKPVLGGALALAALMNIHSYDVLLLALVAVGFLVSSLAAKRFGAAWVGRAGLIALGAVPSALWFVYVLSQDKVFQARAATLTYSPNLQQVTAGLLPLMLLAVVGTALNKDEKRGKAGAGLVALFVVALHLWANGADPGKAFMGPAQFGIVFAVACGIATFLAGDDDFKNLLWSWALVGLVAPYFPALFQRKLAMGLAVPWALLAAIEAGRVLEGMERSSRNLLSALGLLVCSLSSLLWLQRELWFVQTNVASTTLHSVFYSDDVAKIIRVLNEQKGRTVVIAPPGVPSKPDERGRFGTPILPDLNSILSGQTGVYTVSGHWSETPRYQERLRDVSMIFSARVPLTERRRLIQQYQVNYAVVPTFAGQPDSPFGSFDELGQVVEHGTSWNLVKL